MPQLERTLGRDFHVKRCEDDVLSLPHNSRKITIEVVLFTFGVDREGFMRITNSLQSRMLLLTLFRNLLHEAVVNSSIEPQTIRLETVEVLLVCRLYDQNGMVRDIALSCFYRRPWLCPSGSSCALRAGILPPRS